MEKSFFAGAIGLGGVALGDSERRLAAQSASG
jgi:hypothetical protein